ncbi:accessory Sec system glycosyltransferase GtfA [Staphylococcus shinii]|uniref:accessory Sec system glycosyltransferase GtfA n=1 Tax=Staphylococcus shinii TaxID=2912228 RepID=UPI000C331A2C|nr:accessory Sec system glycosyltransferase GtfA [Staphylococcus shinii]PKI09375.1 accessory Sec system glycosyltransferase GtfA [Staphylococcus shinii]
MTIYNINLGIGWASSGVEYAQAYRAKILRNLDISSKFVFLDLFQFENIQHLTANLGYKDDEIIWLYQYFTDIKIAPTTYRIKDILNKIDKQISKIETTGNIKRIFFENNQDFITCYLHDTSKEIVNRAEFVSKGNLIRKDFYSYTKVFSEYYAPFENKAKLYMRQFYNENGSIAFSEYIDNGTQLYIFNDKKFYNKESFIAYFIQQLRLTSKDIIILDRSTHIGQAVLQNKGESKIGVVVHAEHFNESSSDNDKVLWNNYYDYQFTQAREIDFFITATDIQRYILKQQMRHFKGLKPVIKTIPVGSLSKLKYPTRKRKSYSIITASRLASEKHIDWLLYAVIKAKKYLPHLTFDIYGEGVEKGKLQKIIDQQKANGYIQLKGHVNLDEVYTRYELFVTGSTSEGFGLTLMEAVGSGLAMIGFDVNYGNPTFIENEENGYLIPFSADNINLEEITDNISKKIIEYFNGDKESMHEKSYEIAKKFRTDKIEFKWQNLIEEVLND